MMELRTVGKKDRPAVLLLGGREWEAEDLAAALKALKKNYRLLIPIFEAEENAGARLEALEESVVREHAGALWGAYGLDDGAEELLRLLDRDRLDIRTRVVEGSFALPEEAAPPEAGEIRCWTGARDKAGKKALEALRARGGHVAALTLKKLPKGKSTLSYCPSIAAAQLKKAFGDAVSVSRVTTLAAPAERVWDLLCAGPAPKEAARLDRAEPMQRNRETMTLLYEGSSAALPVWHHLIRLEPAGENLTRCTDLIWFKAAGKGGVKKSTVKRYLLYLYFTRALAL